MAMDSSNFFGKARKPEISARPAQENPGVAPAESLPEIGQIKKIHFPLHLHFVEVHVLPGEKIELPMDPQNVFQAQLTPSGDLILKLDDRYIVLNGYAEAAQQSEVIVLNSKGHEVDVADVVAATDPHIDLVTAAEAAQHVLDSSGVYTAFTGAPGLDGIDAVGLLGATSFGDASYFYGNEEERINGVASGGGNPGDLAGGGVARIFTRSEDDLAGATLVDANGNHYISLKSSLARATASGAVNYTYTLTAYDASTPVAPVGGGTTPPPPAPIDPTTITSAGGQAMHVTTGKDALTGHTTISYWYSDPAAPATRIEVLHYDIDEVTGDFELKVYKTLDNQHAGLFGAQDAFRFELTGTATAGGLGTVPIAPIILNYQDAAPSASNASITVNEAQIFVGPVPAGGGAPGSFGDSSIRLAVGEDGLKAVRIADSSVDFSVAGADATARVQLQGSFKGRDAQGRVIDVVTNITDDAGRDIYTHWDPATQTLVGESKVGNAFVGPAFTVYFINGQIDQGNLQIKLNTGLHHTDVGVAPAQEFPDLTFKLNIETLDFDNDFSRVQLTVNVHDSGPVLGGVATIATVDEDALAGGIQGGANDIDARAGGAITDRQDANFGGVDYKGDGANADARLSVIIDLAANDLTNLRDSQTGKHLVTRWDGNNLTAFVDLNDDGNLDPVTEAIPANQVFQLQVLDRVTGDYRFLLNRAISNVTTALATKRDGEEDLAVNFTVKATDSDGTQSTLGGLRVTVNDDRPDFDAAAIQYDFDEEGLDLAAPVGPDGNVGGTGDLGGANDTRVTAANLTTNFNGYGADGGLTSGTNAKFIFEETGTASFLRDSNNNLVKIIGSNLGVQTAWDGATKTLTGYINTNGTAGFQAGQDVTVFTAQITDDVTGKFSFTLNKALQHDPLGNNEDNLDFTLTVDALDNDGDITKNNITFRVNDDTPIAQAGGATAIFNEGKETDHSDAGNNPDISGDVTTNVISFGIDGRDSRGGLVGAVDFLDPVSGAVVRTVNFAGAGPAVINGTFGTLTLNRDGTYIYDRNATAITRQEIETFRFIAQDGDGDQVSSTLAVTINAGPTVTSRTGVVDEDGLTGGIAGGVGDDGTTNSNIVIGGQVVSFGVDGPATGAADGSQNNSPLVFSVDATNSDALLRGLTWTQSADANFFYYKGASAGVPTVEVRIDRADGHYEARLLQALTHPGNTAADLEDNLRLVVNITVHDATFDPLVPNANDSATGTLTIDFDDDSATVTTTDVNNVNESDIAGAGVGVTKSGTLNIGFGADGANATQDIRFDLTDVQDNAGNSILATFKSGGQAISTVWDETNNQLIGFVDSGAAGFQAGEEVFTVKWNKGATPNNFSDDQYDFRLFKAIDHRDAANNPIALANLKFQTSVKDGDGDVTTGTFTVTVNDETPTLGVFNGFTVDEEGLGGNLGDSYPPRVPATDPNNDAAQNTATKSDVAGTLFTAASFGHDGFGSYGLQALTGLSDSLTGGRAIVFTPVTGVGNSIQLVGKVDISLANDGSAFANAVTFTVNKDGSYTFDLLRPVVHPVTGAEDNIDLGIRLTLTDSDGDSTNVDFNVTIDDDAPTFTGSTPQVIVNEDALTGGNLNDTYRDRGQTPDPFPLGTDTRRDAGLGGAPGTTINNVNIGVSFGADKAGANGGLQFLQTGAGAILTGYDDTNGSNAQDGGEPTINIQWWDAGAAIFRDVRTSWDVATGKLFGYADNDGNGVRDLDGSEDVFLATLNKDVAGNYNGTFNFQLFKALRHTGTNAEDDLAFNLTVRATDKDGDSVDQNFKIVVDDDAPRTGGLPTIAVDVTNSHNNPYIVNEDGLANGNTLSGNGNGDFSDAALTGSTLNSKTTATGNPGRLNFDFGADGAAAVGSVTLQDFNGANFLKDTNNNVIKDINGTSVQTLWDAANNTLWGFADTNANGRSAGEDVFSIVFSKTAGIYDGHFTLSLLRALQHPGHVVNQLEDNLLFDVVYTLKDSDGDTDQGIFTVSVDDDSPSIGTLNNPASVSEAGLLDGDAATGSEFSSGEFDFKLANFGADQVGAVARLNLVTAGLQSYKSDGTIAAVSTTWDAATRTLIGFIDATNNGYDAGEEVFKFTLGATGGNVNNKTDYSFHLFKALVHADAAGANNLGLQFNISLTDGDGDSVNSPNFTLNVTDTLPTAGNDVTTLQLSRSDTLTGNVITGTGIVLVSGDVARPDTKSADGGEITSITSDRTGFGANDTDTDYDPTFGFLQVNGKYGILTIQKNGGYSYARTRAITGVAQEVFTYTLTDGDKDAVTATLTINIDTTPQSAVTANPQTLESTQLNTNQSITNFFDFGANGPAATGALVYSVDPNLTIRDVFGNKISFATVSGGGSGVNDKYVGYVDTGNGVYDAGEEVFTVTPTLSLVNGHQQLDFGFKQIKALQHSNPYVADDLYFALKLTAKDSNGDLAFGVLNVDVRDSLPTFGAIPFGGTIKEGQTNVDGSTLTGTITIERQGGSATPIVTFGSDHATGTTSTADAVHAAAVHLVGGPTGITSGGIQITNYTRVVNADETIVEGRIGTVPATGDPTTLPLAYQVRLFRNGSGDFNYEFKTFRPLDNLNGADANLDFLIGASDRDGDEALGTLRVAIQDTVPTLSSITFPGGANQVNESGLANGTQPSTNPGQLSGSNGLFTRGTLQVNLQSGTSENALGLSIASITAPNIFTLATYSGRQQLAMDITEDAQFFYLRGWDTYIKPATGSAAYNDPVWTLRIGKDTLIYEFQALRTSRWNPFIFDNELPIELAVKVRDIDGSVSNASTISFRVADDSPLANDDFWRINTQRTTTITGNVITGVNTQLDATNPNNLWTQSALRGASTTNRDFLGADGGHLFSYWAVDADTAATHAQTGYKVVDNSEVAIAGTAGGLGTWVDGRFGKFQIDINGNYQYVFGVDKNGNAVNTSGVVFGVSEEVFVYTLIDNGHDGQWYTAIGKSNPFPSTTDLAGNRDINGNLYAPGGGGSIANSSATFRIQIVNNALDPSVPLINVPDSARVYETALPTGSIGQSNSVVSSTYSGVITIDTHGEGVSQITFRHVDPNNAANIDTVTLTQAQLATLVAGGGGTVLTETAVSSGPVANQHGSRWHLVVDSWDSATGRLGYRIILDAAANNNNYATIPIDVTVQDVSGDSTAVQLRTSIIDDNPLNPVTAQSVTLNERTLNAPQFVDVGAKFGADGAQVNAATSQFTVRLLSIGSLIPNANGQITGLQDQAGNNLVASNQNDNTSWNPLTQTYTVFREIGTANGRFDGADQAILQIHIDQVGSSAKYTATLLQGINHLPFGSDTVPFVFDLFMRDGDNFIQAGQTLFTVNIVDNPVPTLTYSSATSDIRVSEATAYQIDPITHLPVLDTTTNRPIPIGGWSSGGSGDQAYVDAYHAANGNNDPAPQTAFGSINVQGGGDGLASVTFTPQGGTGVTVTLAQLQNLGTNSIFINDRNGWGTLKLVSYNASGTLVYSYTVNQGNNVAGNTYSTSFGVSITDGNGDTVSTTTTSGGATIPANIVVTIEDDIPVAHSQINNSVQYDINSTYYNNGPSVGYFYGNLLTGAGAQSNTTGLSGVIKGADGVSLNSLVSQYGAGVTTNGSFQFGNQFGVTYDRKTVGGDATHRFTLFWSTTTGDYAYEIQSDVNGSTASPVTYDTLTYSVRDVDGDISTATLALKVQTQVSTTPPAGPVVLDLNQDGHLALTDLAHSNVYFDYGNDGTANRTGWVGSEDGFLIIDLGRDRQVTQSKEFVFTEWNADARTDLQAVALTFDDNHDGKLDASDSRFGEFAIWQDLNQNGKSDQGEVKSLAEWGITSLNLQSDGFTVDADGNIVYGTSLFTKMDGSTGIAGDVSLAVSSDSLPVDPLPQPPLEDAPLLTASSLVASSFLVPADSQIVDGYYIDNDGNRLAVADGLQEQTVQVPQALLDDSSLVGVLVDNPVPAASQENLAQPANAGVFAVPVSVTELAEDFSTSVPGHTGQFLDADGNSIASPYQTKLEESNWQWDSVSVHNGGVILDLQNHIDPSSAILADIHVAVETEQAAPVSHPDTDPLATPFDLGEAGLDRPYEADATLLASNLHYSAGHADDSQSGALITALVPAAEPETIGFGGTLDMDQAAHQPNIVAVNVPGGGYDVQDIAPLWSAYVPPEENKEEGLLAQYDADGNLLAGLNNNDLFSTDYRPAPEQHIVQVHVDLGDLPPPDVVPDVVPLPIPDPQDQQDGLRHELENRNS